MSIADETLIRDIGLRNFPDLFGALILVGNYEGGIDNSRIRNLRKKSLAV